MNTVLITGASGLLGKELTSLLLKNGFQVNHLGRTKTQNLPTGIRSFIWDVDKGKIDKSAFKGVNAIVHLAGAGVADKRWTQARKKEILESRTKSTALLFDTLKNIKHEVSTFVSASAVGFYGDCGNEPVDEKRPAANTFLADVCKQWEEGAARFQELGIREVRCRIGIVLSKNGGALPELERTIPLGVAGYFAKEHLYYPWIHIDDVCGIMMHALQNENLSGAYNTTANQPLLIKDLMHEIVKAKKSNAVLMPVPRFALKIALGEMSEMLLSSQNCTSRKIMATGYKFLYPEIGGALCDIYNTSSS